MNLFTTNQSYDLQKNITGILIHVGIADSELTDEEIKNLLGSLFNKKLFIGVPVADFLEDIFITAVSPEHEQYLQKYCLQIPDEWKLPVFAMCCELILKDGRVNNSEVDLLSEIEIYMNISTDDARSIKSAISHLYYDNI